MKGFFKRVGYAAGAAIGYCLGMKIWNKLTDPVEKAKLKRKFKKVKDAICEKEES